MFRKWKIPQGRRGRHLGAGEGGTAEKGGSRMPPGEGVEEGGGHHPGGSCCKWDRLERKEIL